MLQNEKKNILCTLWKHVLERTSDKLLHFDTYKYIDLQKHTFIDV